MKTCLNCQASNQDAANFCKTCGLPLHSGATRLQPGQVLNNRYTVVRALSKGGMGAIYLVQDRGAFGTCSAWSRRCWTT
ncbi:MAG: hypothetical protein V9H69_22785 [Anaerolineae bacterium]